MVEVDTKVGASVDVPVLFRPGRVRRADRDNVAESKLQSASRRRDRVARLVDARSEPVIDSDVVTPNSMCSSADR